MEGRAEDKRGMSNGLSLRQCALEPEPEQQLLLWDQNMGKQKLAFHEYCDWDQKLALKKIMRRWRKDEEEDEKDPDHS